MPPYPTQWAGYDPKRFMCCICFGILDVVECAVDAADGYRVDVCKDCYERDNNEFMTRAMAIRALKGEQR